MFDAVSYSLGKKAGGGGANLQEKSVSITTNGTTNVLPDENYDGMTKVSVTTDVQPNLETKSVTITENTTTTITPTSGKDGMSSIEVITEVPTSTKPFPDVTNLQYYTSNYTVYRYVSTKDDVVMLIFWNANVSTYHPTLLRYNQYISSSRPYGDGQFWQSNSMSAIYKLVDNAWVLQDTNTTEEKRYNLYQNSNGGVVNVLYSSTIVYDGIGGAMNPDNALILPTE